MPNAMRQSGPRPSLRHLAPAGNAQASRGLPAASQRVGKSLDSISCGLLETGAKCLWEGVLLESPNVNNINVAENIVKTSMDCFSLLTGL